MILAMLRAYAVQLEEIAKLELADLSQALQRSIERMAMLESRARRDADLYLAQVREGSTITQAYAQFEAMDQAIAARKKNGTGPCHAASAGGGQTERIDRGHAISKEAGVVERPLCPGTASSSGKARPATAR